MLKISLLIISLAILVMLLTLKKFFTDKEQDEVKLNIYKGLFGISLLLLLFGMAFLLEFLWGPQWLSKFMVF